METLKLKFIVERVSKAPTKLTTTSNINTTYINFVQEPYEL